MHLIPVVVVAHVAGPAGWEAGLDDLVRAVTSHPGAPLLARFPGAALEHLGRVRGAELGRLTGQQVGWLAGGYSDPVLATLPPSAVGSQLDREHTAMETAGIVPVGLWIGDAWEPALITTARRAGFTTVYLEEELVGPEADRPAPVERAGETVMAVAVRRHPPPDLATDGLVGVRVPAGALGPFMRSHRGRLLPPEGYLASHPPGPRLPVGVATPARAETAEHLYRRLLLLVGDESDPSRPREEILRLESREFTTGDGERGAVERLLGARAALDRFQHRGDGWVTTRMVDWDADGVEEVHVETASTSLVVDPASGSIEVWDDKPSGWPICGVQPHTPGSLVRSLGADGEEPLPEPLRLERRSEGKGEAQMILTGLAGTRVEVEIRGRTLEIDVEPAGLDALRFGPELPLAMEAPRVRVDGGEWLAADAPLALAGHRFRIAGADHALLVSSPRPTDLFVRPLAGGGIVIWPHWARGGAGSHRLTFAVV